MFIIDQYRAPKMMEAAKPMMLPPHAISVLFNRCGNFVPHPVALGAVLLTPQRLCLAESEAEG